MKIIYQKNGFGKPEKNHPKDKIFKKPEYLVSGKSHTYKFAITKVCKYKKTAPTELCNTDN